MTAQASVKHVVTAYVCVGTGRQRIGTHKHRCACGWSSVEHSGTDVEGCSFTDERCPVESRDGEPEVTLWLRALGVPIRSRQI